MPEGPTISALVQQTRALLWSLDAALADADIDRAHTAVREYMKLAARVIDPPAVERRPPPPNRLLEAADPERAARSWLRGVAGLLGEWRLDDAAHRVEAAPLELPPRLAGAQPLLRGGVRAMRAGRHADTDEMVEFLLHIREVAPRITLDGADAPPRHLVTRAQRAPLLVYLGRLALLRDGDPERALEFFRKAARLSPEDGTAQAALGSYHQYLKESSEALTAYQHAIALAPERPDGYVGMGWLADAEGRPDEAEEWFARAIETATAQGGAERALSRLYAPVPAALLLQCAHRSVAEEPSVALARLDAALTAAGGSKDEELFQRISALRAEILDGQGRTDEAADACYMAALGWTEAPEEYRADLLERAIRLDSTHQPAHWELAETLRLRSFEPGGQSDEHVEHALDVWTDSFRLAAPGEGFSWAYLTRGLLEERRAVLSGERRLERYLEAVAWIERAVLHGADRFGWLHLCRCLAALRLTANAIAAGTEALAYAPDDPDALATYAAVLALGGRYDDVERAVERVLELEPSMWAREVRSRTWVMTGRAREALDEVQSLLAEVAEDDLENREPLIALRARCHRGLGHREAELADYEEVVRIHDAGSPDALRDYAWAQYSLGWARGESERLAEAVLMLDALAEDAYERDGALACDRGLAHLATGDAELGSKLVREALERAVRQFDVDEAIADLNALRPKTSGPARAEIDALVGEAARRRDTVALPAPEEELAAWAADAGDRGALALTLVRLARARKAWAEALELARGLAPADALAVVASTASDMVADAHERLRAGEAPAALLKRAGEALEGVGDAELEAHAAGRLALAQVRSGEPAHAALERTLARLRDAGETDAVGALWSMLGGLTADDREVWQLDDLVRSIPDPHVPSRSLDATGAILALAGLERDSEPFHDPRSVVQLGESLIAEDTGPGWSLFRIHLPRMRERLLDETGVHVPGTLFGAGWDLNPMEYEVVIGGLLAARDRAFAHDGEEPIADVVRGLERVLRRNAAEGLDAEEVLALLEKRQIPVPMDGLSKLRLARLARALADDRVPLHDWAALLAAAEQGGSVTAQAVTVARRMLRKSLPGNEAGRPRVALPSELEEQIVANFDVAHGARALLTSPLEADRLERLLAEWVAGTRPGAAVVTTGDGLRPLVQRMLWRHHPDVTVLAREELLEGNVAEAEAPTLPADALHG